MTFSEKVKFRRESLGYSQHKLAELVGVTTKIITGPDHAEITVAIAAPRIPSSGKPNAPKIRP